MTHMYDQLLEELGIHPAGNSYEISRQLKEKGNEKKALMSSRLSLEENKRLEDEIHRINEAEDYYEKLAQDEKKEDKLDGFDYSSLQNKGRKNRRVRHVMPVATSDDASQEDENLSFEERYDNIIGFMGTPDGFDAGLKQLEQLAEDGYVVAQRRLGRIYFFGEKNINKNWKTSEYWFEKAANQGDASSQNFMGAFYAEDNIYFPKDRQQAIKWFQLAADQDLAVAWWNMGRCYDTFFEPKDEKKAFSWYKKAAELGHARACFKVGYLYVTGSGVQKDVKEAIKWWEKAADNGISESCYNLGLAYENNEDVKDIYKAFEWYKKGANAGEGHACNKVGIFYEKGYAGTKNIAEAIKWYEKAIECDCSDACYNLGLLYESENEVKDITKSFYWFNRAAEANIPDAMYRLGIIYEKYYYNNSEAAKWYAKAMAAGYQDAKQAYDRVSER